MGTADLKIKEMPVTVVGKAVDRAQCTDLRTFLSTLDDKDVRKREEVTQNWSEIARQLVGNALLQL